MTGEADIWEQGTQQKVPFGHCPSILNDPNAESHHSPDSGNERSFANPPVSVPEGHGVNVPVSYGRIGMGNWLFEPIPVRCNLENEEVPRGTRAHDWTEQIPVVRCRTWGNGDALRNRDAPAILEGEVEARVMELALI